MPPNLRRLIGPFNLADDLTCCQKWLKAGILEDEVVTISERRTGQGSVISPLLANIYLHYAFDLLANRWRQREATGEMIVVRRACLLYTSRCV